MCNTIKWSFAAAYVIALLSEGPSNFSGLLLSLGLPWTLFLDSLGKHSGT